MFLAKDKPANLTTGSIANTSRHAGKKPGHTSKKRSRGNEPVEILPKVTLGEVLRDIPPDCSQLQYTAKPAESHRLKVTLTRVTSTKPKNL